MDNILPVPEFCSEGADVIFLCHKNPSGYGRKENSHPCLGTEGGSAGNVGICSDYL